MGHVELVFVTRDGTYNQRYTDEGGCEEEK